MIAVVSPETLARLTDEACRDHRCEGMTREDIAEWVAGQIAKLLASYPWWFGHRESDQPSKPKQPCTDAQRQALEKARVARRRVRSWRDIEA